MAEMDCKALFLDIGGVLLTNGWDRKSRDLAAQQFGIDREEMQERHHLTFDTYEVGKITLEEYLNRVIFHEKRAFSRDQFLEFMYAQSSPYPEMIDLVRRVKEFNCLKIAVVSNEGRELTEHRIRTFGLDSFVDFFISSCFVHFRKPDPDIYRIALDIAQVPAGRVIYIEDRLMFAQIAQDMGIRAIVHRDWRSTGAELESHGLAVRE